MSLLDYESRNQKLPLFYCVTFVIVPKNWDEISQRGLPLLMLDLQKRFTQVFRWSDELWEKNPKLLVGDFGCWWFSLAAADPAEGKPLMLTVMGSKQRPEPMNTESTERK